LNDDDESRKVKIKEIEAEIAQLEKRLNELINNINDDDSDYSPGDFEERYAHNNKDDFDAWTDSIWNDPRLTVLVEKLKWKFHVSEKEFYKRYIESTEQKMEKLIVQHNRYAAVIKEIQDKQTELDSRLFALEHSMNGP
jgi:chaperonin cofactor prefoldin